MIALASFRLERARAGDGSRAVWCRAGPVAHRSAATFALADSVQRGSFVRCRAVRTLSRIDRTFRLDTHAVAVRNRIWIATGHQPLGLPGLPYVFARPRSRRLPLRVARLRRATALGCGRSQLSGWLEYRDRAASRALGVARRRAARGSAAQTARGYGAGRNLAGIDRLARGGVGMVRPGRRNYTRRRRGRAANEPAPGFRLDDVSFGHRGGMVILSWLSRCS